VLYSAAAVADILLVHHIIDGGKFEDTFVYLCLILREGTKNNLIDLCRHLI
jgi:hypothetical protein